MLPLRSISGEMISVHPPLSGERIAATSTSYLKKDFCHCVLLLERELQSLPSMGVVRRVLLLRPVGGEIIALTPTFRWREDCSQFVLLVEGELREILPVCGGRITATLSKRRRENLCLSGLIVERDFLTPSF